YGDREVDEILSFDEEMHVGFSSNLRKGKVLFLPCQRDFNRPESIQKCLTALVNALVTYKSRSSLELPEWASQPIFPHETELDEQHSELKVQIENIESEINLYQVAKQIALLSEYQFQDAVPKFFETH